MKIEHLLTEAANPKVGRKYQHIEDLVLSDGSHGAMHAIERLKHMGEEGGSIELKWDGMPVVYWGRDEAGNFSMIPKNAWAYLKRGQTQTSSGAPTVMKSPEDVQAFILGTGSGDPTARQGFAKQFASLWPYFEKISPKQGYLEGGLLFYPGTKPDGETAMPVLNKETNTYDFTPNITTFHIPIDSELGKQIPKSKMMVAATGYFATMGSSDEQRFPDAQKLSVPGIIVQGTTYVQDPVELDFQGLSNLEAFIKKNAQLIDNYLAPKPGLSNPGGELYSYLNKHLRTEGLLADFPQWANATMSPKKAQTMLSDPKGLQATLGAVEGLSKQKNVLIGQLSQGLHGGIKQTKPEGYAQAHPGKSFKYDIPGQFVKTIDQTNWKPRESVVSEAKGGKKAVIGWGRGMGHTGHDALATSVIHQAEQTGASPFFVVSRSFGKDDPIPPETKLAMYQKKFPKYAKMFSLPSADAPTLNDVLAKLATKGYSDVTLVVGADQKEAFGYLTRPAKDGVPPYQKFGLNSLQIMSRQDTKAPGSDPTQQDYHEGPRATPMREVLLDPNKSEQEQFAVWRQAMSSSLSDQEVLQMMNTAKENLTKFNTPKPKGRKLKEFIERIKPLLEHASPEQKARIYDQLLEARKQLNEFAPGNGDDGLPHAEYVVYQCDPNDQFEFMGRPLYQSDNLGMAHKYAYEMYVKYRPKAFVIYQPHREASRGNYGVKGESDEELAEGSIGDKIKGAAKSVKRATQGWGVGAAPDMITPKGVVQAFGDMDGQRLANFVASRKDFSKPGKDSARAFADKVIDREMKQRGYGRVADKDEQGVAEGAPIVVAQAPIDVRNPKKAPQPYRNQGDIVPPAPPPSTEKRGVKGRPGQRPMPEQDVAEGQYEDQEMDQVYRFAQQHYPNMHGKQAAFVKYVMHALKHSEQDDSRQDQEIQDLEQEVNDLQAKTKVAESSDYIDEK